jgi:hypothetical protein
MSKKLSTSSQPEKLRRMKSSDIMLTKKLRAQLTTLKNVEVQPDEDAPEITDWSQAQVEKFYRPIKKQITLRLDADTFS